MTTIIAKNNTSSAIPLFDLGIEIPGSGQRNLTDNFTVLEVYTSVDLRTNVQSGNIFINDGTQDLNLDDSLSHINFETEYEDIDPVDSTSVIAHSLEDHTDVVGLNPSEEYILKFVNGKWRPSQLHYNDSVTEPDSTSVIWINPTEYEPYYFHDESSTWVSASKNIYTYGRSGNISGSYLGIGGWSTGGYYYIPTPGGLITSLYCRASAGNLSKIFQVHINNINVHQFQLVNGLYEDNTLVIDIPSSAILQIWCSSTGNPVSDVVCQLTMHWKNEVI